MTAERSDVLIGCERLDFYERGYSSLHIYSERWVQSLSECILDAGPNAQWHDFQLQSELLQRETQHLGHRMWVHVVVVPLAGEEVEADSMLHTSSTSAPLLCIAARDETVDKAADLALFIIPHFSMPT